MDNASRYPRRARRSTTVPEQAAHAPGTRTIAAKNRRRSRRRERSQRPPAALRPPVSSVLHPQQSGTAVAGCGASERTGVAAPLERGSDGAPRVFRTPLSRLRRGGVRSLRSHGRPLLVPSMQQELSFAIARSDVRALLIGRRALIALGLPLNTRDYDFWIHIDDIQGTSTRSRSSSTCFPTERPRMRARSDATCSKAMSTSTC